MTGINYPLPDFLEADTLKVGHVEGWTLLSIRGDISDMSNINDRLSDILETDSLKFGFMEG